jgi:hypothetical protein
VWVPHITAFHPGDQSEFNIFLSHAVENKRSTVSFFYTLAARDAQAASYVRPFLDEKDLKPGERNDKAMKEALENAAIGEHVMCCSVLCLT